VTSLWHHRDVIVTRKSGMSDVLDEDATTMLATCPQQVVRVELVEFGERHDTRTNGQHCTAVDRRPTNQVSACQLSWTAKWPNTPDILVASSQGCRTCQACRQGCHKYTTRMLRGNCSRGIPAIVIVRDVKSSKRPRPRGQKTWYRPHNSWPRPWPWLRWVSGLSLV